MRFASVSERWIESRHAIAKRHLSNAPNSSATHLAFHGLQRPLRDFFQSGATDLEELAAFCERMSKPIDCLREMGFWQHPVVVRLREAVPHWKINHNLQSEIADILYHVDAFSLHAPLPADESAHEERGEPHAVGGGGSSSGGGADPMGGGCPQPQENAPAGAGLAQQAHDNQGRFGYWGDLSNYYRWGVGG